MVAFHYLISTSAKSGRRDLNPRPLDPQAVRKFRWPQPNLDTIPGVPSTSRGRNISRNTPRIKGVFGPKGYVPLWEKGRGAAWPPRPGGPLCIRIAKDPAARDSDPGVCRSAGGAG